MWLPGPLVDRPWIEMAGLLAVYGAIGGFQANNGGGHP